MLPSTPSVVPNVSAQPSSIRQQPSDRVHVSVRRLFLNMLCGVVFRVVVTPFYLGSWIVQKVKDLFRKVFYFFRTSSKQKPPVESTMRIRGEQDIELTREVRIDEAIVGYSDTLSVDDCVTILKQQLEISKDNPHPFAARKLNQHLWQLANEFNVYFANWCSLASDVCKDQENGATNIEDKYATNFSQMYEMQCRLYKKYVALSTTVQKIDSAISIRSFRELFDFKIYCRYLPDAFYTLYCTFVNLNNACKRDSNQDTTIDTPLKKQSLAFDKDTEDTVFKKMKSYIKHVQAYSKDKHHGPQYLKFLSENLALTTAYYKNLAHELNMFGGEDVDLKEPVTALVTAWTELAECTGFEKGGSMAGKIPKDLLLSYHKYATFLPLQYFRDLRSAVESVISPAN